MADKPPTADLRDVIASKLTELRTAGHNTVLIDELFTYLGTLPAPDEQHRHFEWSRTVASLSHAGSIELFKSVMEAGQTALKILITINGGAAAALLAFLSNIIGKQPGTPLQARIAGAMAVYVAGVALAGGSSVCRYFAQYSSARAGEAKSNNKERAWRWWTRAGDVFVGLAILFGLGSIGAFCIGGRKSYLALR